MAELKSPFLDGRPILSASDDDRIRPLSSTFETPFLQELALATDRAFAPTDEAESFAGEVQFEELEPLQDEQARDLESHALPELADDESEAEDTDGEIDEAYEQSAETGDESDEAEDSFKADHVPELGPFELSDELTLDEERLPDAAEIEEEGTGTPDRLSLTFTAKTLPVRVAVLVTQAARQARQVEVLVFAHGLDVCAPVLKHRPMTFITERPFNLGDLVEASGRPIVLVVPFLDWEHLGQNKMAFGNKWHKLAKPERLNGVVSEVLEHIPALTGSTEAPTLLRLILAGHSRAFGFFDALARAHADPEMSNGALGRLSHVWALDATYTSPIADWRAWLRSREGFNITVIYRHGKYRRKKSEPEKSLSTGIHGREFRALAATSNGRLAAMPVAAGKVGHCAIPGAYLPRLLETLPMASAKGVARESYAEGEEEADLEILNAYEAHVLDGEETEHDEETEPRDDEADAFDMRKEKVGAEDEEEWEEQHEENDESEPFEPFAELSNEDEEREFLGIDQDETENKDAWNELPYAEAEGSEEEVLGGSGLTPAELKAVQITSTFETGRPGGFFGLSGNFDGQGLSFGLVNWTIGTGSLQPLLRAFAAEQPDRWNAIFGTNAAAFSSVIAPKGKAAEAAQLRFAIETMNSSRLVKGKRTWSIKEPWFTYFKRLSEEPAFQRIQVRYVRDLLDRARYFCETFRLKSERAFAFMFDAVSSHGKWWLTKKWKNGVQKRRELLRARLATLKGTHGKGNVPERDLLLAIADVLADTSAARWSEKVRIRKRWFVTGEHPRAKELKNLTPRPDVPYLTQVTGGGAQPQATQPVPAPAPAKTPAKASTSAPRGQMSDAKRKEAIAAALTQATTAGQEEDRKAIAATLKANGTNLVTWFRDIVPDATFLGRAIRASGGMVPGVHRSMLDALERAERALLDKYPGRTAEQLGKELGVYDIAGVRPPKKATGATLPSFHCFGLAVDINHKTNPFVGNLKARTKGYEINRSPRIIERAMRLLHGERFNVEADLKTGGGVSGAAAAWEIHHRASETLAKYLRLADNIDGQQVRDLVAKVQAMGDTENLAWWKGWITTDRKVISRWDFQHHPHPENGGYMDLPRELVVALVGAGLKWGGQYRGAKDIMHFDLRDGPIKHRPT